MDRNGGGVCGGGGGGGGGVGEGGREGTGGRGEVVVRTWVVNGGSLSINRHKMHLIMGAVSLWTRPPGPVPAYRAQKNHLHPNATTESCQDHQEPTISQQ